MTSVPLHPALVHLPLGLAFVLPILTVGFSWALWKGSLPPRGWLAMVVLQAVLLGSGLVALKAGQNEQDRVESTVPKMALEKHEELAEQFLWITASTLAASALVLVVRRRARAVQALTVATMLGSFLTAAAALRVGHAGGELVYVHNAAAAYVSAGKATAQAGDAALVRSPAAQSSTAAKDDD